MLDRPIGAGGRLGSTQRRRSPGGARYSPLWRVATVVGLMSLAVIAVPPRSVGAVLFLALFAVTLPWSVIGFWNATIGFLLMTGARDPVAAVNPMARRIRGRRGNHRSDRDPHVHPQRGAGPGDPQSAPARGWPRGCARSSFVSHLSPERHQRSRDRRRRGGLFRRVRRRGRRPRRRSPTGAAKSIRVSKPAISAISATDGAATTNSP